MRMTPQQAEIVRMSAHRHFGEDAVIWLFGSRADDGKKGGDCGFLVETSLDQIDIIVEPKWFIRKMRITKSRCCRSGFNPTCRAEARPTLQWIIWVEHKIAMIAELQSASIFEDEKTDLIVKRRNSSFRKWLPFRVGAVG